MGKQKPDRNSKVISTGADMNPLEVCYRPKAESRVEQSPRVEPAVEGKYWAMGTVAVKGRTRSADG